MLGCLISPFFSIKFVWKCFIHRLWCHNFWKISIAIKSYFSQCKNLVFRTQTKCKKETDHKDNQWLRKHKVVLWFVTLNAIWIQSIEKDGLYYVSSTIGNKKIFLLSCSCYDKMGYFSWKHFIFCANKDIRKLKRWSHTKQKYSLLKGSDALMSKQNSFYPRGFRVKQKH